MEWINFVFRSSAQQMVLVSITALLIVTIGILFYRFVWPKRNIAPVWLVLLLSLPPLLSILRPGVYESGDLAINVIKTMSFADNLAEGNLIPRWAGELNAGYGYPAHLFAYPLPYYLASFQHYLGFSYIAGVKGVMILAFVLSGLGMYWWLKEEVSPGSAALGAILYLYAPYHLVDLHFRVAIGELMAMAIMPLTLWATARFGKVGSRWVLILISLGIGLTILSHQALALLFIPFLLVYGWIRSRKRLGWFLTAFILGVMLASFYWLPVLTESQFTHQTLYAAAVWFPPAYQFIYSPWRWGLLFQGPKGELSYIIGYIQILLVLAAMGLLIFGRKVKARALLFLLIIFLVIYSLMLFQITEPIWNMVAILKNLQFSYRFLGLVILFSAAIGAVVAENIKPKRQALFIVSVMILAIGVTILNWGNRKNLPDINDSYLRKVLPRSTANGEGLQPAAPRWTSPDNPWQKNIAPQPLTIVNGGAQEEKIWRNTYRKYQVNLDKPGRVTAHTLYFPGWKLYVNGRSQEIEETKITPKGEITFDLPAGEHSVELKFEDTYMRRAGKTLSLIALMILVSSGLLIVIPRRGLKSFGVKD